MCTEVWPRIFVFASSSSSLFSLTDPRLVNLNQNLARHKAVLGLVHGDMRLDNWCFFPDGTLGLVDWQGAFRGAVIGDVSWMLYLSCTPELAAQKEEEVFQLYFRLLQDAVAPKKLDEALWRSEARIATRQAEVTSRGLNPWVTNRTR